MIIASNTSPLTNLAAIGHFELLQMLYGEIHIAQGVWHELNHGGGVILAVMRSRRRYGFISTR